MRACARACVSVRHAPSRAGPIYQSRYLEEGEGILKKSIKGVCFSQLLKYKTLADFFVGKGHLMRIGYLHNLIPIASPSPISERCEHEQIEIHRMAIEQHLDHDS